MSKTAEMPTPVGERLKTARERLAAEESARLWYTLRVVVPVAGSGLTPPPFYKCDVSIPATQTRPSRCFTFADQVEATVADPRKPDETRKVEKTGLSFRLTEAELEALRGRIGDYVARWNSRPAGIALVIDTKTHGFVLNPDTDEPIDQWLAIDGPFADKP